MAEKSTFENELPKKSTVKWLRGLDENGNPVLIDISDHATVVGGLIGTNTSNKDGLIKAGNLCTISVPYLKSIRINIESDMFFVTNNYGKSLDYFNFYGHQLTFKKRLGDNNSNLKYYYDSTNHIFYIQSLKSVGADLEISILNMQNRVTNDITNDDLSGFEEIIF